MKKETNDKLSIFIWAVVGVILLQIIVGLSLIFFLDSWNNRAAFGDMFGLRSSLFTGLAFAAVIYSLYLQRQDLKITQKEFQKSVKAQNEQAESLKETALLNALNTLVNSYTELTLCQNRAGDRAFADEYDEKRDEAIQELEEKYQELVDEYDIEIQEVAEEAG